MEQDSVRRCHRCQNPAVIIVNRWEQRKIGVIPVGGPGKTEHRCQSCGAGFILQPQMLMRFVVGAGAGGSMCSIGVLSLIGSVIALFTQGPAEAGVLVVLGLITITFGAATLYYWAGPQIHAWRNPIVVGVRAPELRLGPAEDWRVCSCGAAARCVGVSERTLNGLPAGTTRRYACSSCNAEFSVLDAWGVTVRAAGATAATGATIFLASLLPFDELNGSHIFILVVLALLAGVGGFLAALGVRGRRAHPPAGQSPT